MVDQLAEKKRSKTPNEIFRIVTEKIKSELPPNVVFTGPTKVLFFKFI
jgi:hypothetical protein